MGHYMDSPDALETVLRAVQAVHNESWLYDAAKLEDDTFVATRLDEENAARLWARVQAGEGPIEAAEPIDGAELSGTHSYHVVVVDADGNAITGVNSIGSLPWGEGLFVQGAALTGSSAAAGWTEPGGRPLDPMADHLVFRDGELWMVGGTFAASMLEASLQLTLNVVDYGFSAEEAAARLRFCTFAFNMDDLSPMESPGIWLDPQVPPEIVEELQGRGFVFIRDGWVGLGSIVLLSADGTLDAGICGADGDVVRPEGY